MSNNFGKDLQKVTLFPFSFFLFLSCLSKITFRGNRFTYETMSGSTDL